MPIRKEMLQRYPKDWALRSRFVRFYSARNRCEWCGVHNYTRREDTSAIPLMERSALFISYTSFTCPTFNKASAPPRRFRE